MISSLSAFCLFVSISVMAIVFFLLFTCKTKQVITDSTAMQGVIIVIELAE
jgi:hypothetical protein